MSKKFKNKVILVFFVFVAFFLFVNALFMFEKSVDKGRSKKNIIAASNELTIHYKRTNGDYDNYTLWVWHDTSWTGSWPNGLEKSGTDSFGAIYNIPLNPGATNIGIVPVDKTKGDSGKDGGDHVFNFVDSYKELWIFQGDDNLYIGENKEKPKGLISGQITGDDKIDLMLFNLTSLTVGEVTVKDKDDVSITVSAVSEVKNSVCTVTIATTDYKTKAPYKVTLGTKTISISPGYKLLDTMAYTGDDLGYTYSSGATTFKVWAPAANSVKLTIYKASNQAQSAASKFGSDASGDIVMTKGVSGVYSVTVNGDLKGYFYQYKVTNSDGIERLCLDPYAKSMAAFYVGSDGKVVSGALDNDIVGKGAIIDLADTSVTGLNFAQNTSTPFANYYKKREDAMIYEVHIRDFTSFWGVKPSGTTSTEVSKPAETLGTFKAFIKNLPYLKKMGYTHIQLLPIMNFWYGDESNKNIETVVKGENNNYNWGFDPHHYFTPEGMYATDEKNPITRVKELKELIHAIHEKDMGVVLDVVFTHMAKANFLNDIVPKYYFFMKNDNFVGGFGNNLATTHKMAQKLMVDSIKYWLNEYKVDGFRFDMMGDGTDESIMEVYREAAKINPSVLMIGEGWTTFAGEGNPSDKGADQNAMNKINDGTHSIYSSITWSDYSGVGVFSDEFRNLMKSGFGSETTPRFLTGGVINLDTLFLNFKGQPKNFNTKEYSYTDRDSANDPGQVVQYISAHDNETLHDVIMMHTEKDPSDANNEELIHKRIRIGNTVLYTIQGIVFQHAGCELGRTKSFGNATGDGPKVRVVTFDNGNKLAISRDSYDSSDAINMIDWSMIEDGKPGKKTMEYTRGLIKLRRSTDAFRLGSKSLINSKVTVIKALDK